MKKTLCIGVLLLSINGVQASEVAAATGSQEVAQTTVTAENFWARVPEIYEKGGVAGLRSAVSLFENAYLSNILNPDIAGDKRKKHPLEYAFVKKDEKLFLWLLRKGADSESLNGRGKPIHTVVDEQPYIDHMIYDRKRKKVEHLVIDALQGVSLEQLAEDLHYLIKNDVQASAEEDEPLAEELDEISLSREDIIQILTDIIEESSTNTRTISELLATFRGDAKAELLNKGGYDIKVVGGAFVAGAILTWLITKSAQNSSID